MARFRFYDTCDRCGDRSEEYSPFPLCTSCSDQVCHQCSTDYDEETVSATCHDCAHDIAFLDTLTTITEELRP